MATKTRDSLSAKKLLTGMGACAESMAWVGDRTPAAAWRECPRGDWLLWSAAKANVDRTLVVLAACDCARTVLEFVSQSEPRPLRAIETAEAWCRGEATLAQVRDAAGAAYAAYAAASPHGAAYAAYAATYAAYAAAYATTGATGATGATSAAYAAAYAADAADAAYAATYADAAAYAAADAARGIRVKLARIARRRLPWRTVREALAYRGQL